MNQLDLFAATIIQPPPAPKPAPPTDPLAILKPPTFQWERKLLAAGPIETKVHVYTRWTGEVIEVLCSDATGRLFLFKDGAIREMPHDSGSYRTVFMSIEAARNLHRKHRLVLRMAGTHGAEFRLAAAGETTHDDPFEGHVLRKADEP